MKQIEVTILGQSYILGCPEDGEARLMAAVARVDAEMAKIRAAGKVRARERMAVLAALNLAWGEDGTPDDAPVDAHEVRPPAAGLPTPDAQAQIDALVRRLDEALGEDGQLL